MLTLKFKDNTIKERFINSSTFDRICESNGNRVKSLDFVKFGLEIHDEETLSFITQNSFDDLSVACEILHFEYAFCIFDKDSQKIILNSSIGNILTDNGEIMYLNGNFADINQYNALEQIFLNIMFKNWDYFNILYYHGTDINIR